jgi:CRISPR-associated protein (TIGR03985 family)
MPPIFNYSPSKDFLKSLTAGSLKQNLPKALRLYIILSFIYGEESYKNELSLEDSFTFTEWRDQFFLDAEKYHVQEEKPQFHDPSCRCSFTLKDWVFSFYPDPKEQRQWCKDLQKEYCLTDDKLEELLTWGIISTQKSINPNPDNKSKREPLDNGRLFAVSAKTLRNDLEALVKQGWLQKKKNEQRENVFLKVENFPNIAKNYDDQQIELCEIINPDLATTLKILAAPINDIQRFSLHVEYVIPQNSVEPTEDLAAFLRKLWEADNFPVMQLKYDSAKYWSIPTLIVYPVYIFYYQRALYLCAYGQTPKSRDKDVISWYNYRMDRIREWGKLDWRSSLIPDNLLNFKKQGKLPNTEQIQIAFDQAWGLDFYEESSPLLLRFKRAFNDKYIQDTCRHQTFKLIESEKELKSYIRKIATNKNEEERMLARVKEFPEDAYYQAIYRVNDNNILMRLQAWNPNIEVLFPGHLRERIIKEIEETGKMYN